ncbi:MAG: response regulator transcription factor [Candidatus Saccharimonadales bacterium]
MVDPKAILIEDNRAVSETLSAALSQTYTLISTQSGNEGLRIIKSERPDLIILDLNLPDISGLKICSEARRIGVKAPILVLSGDGSLSTKLELFSAGADDYMVKPFSLGELEARLKAMSRRITSYKQMVANPRTPSLVLDRANECVIREGSQPIQLRHKEYAVLEYLIKYAGQTVDRERLVASIWKGNKKPWSNSIDVHVKTLRDKIDKPFKRQLITTIHGVGYRLEDK